MILKKSKDYITLLRKQNLYEVFLILLFVIGGILLHGNLREVNQKLIKKAETSYRNTLLEK